MPDSLKRLARRAGLAARLLLGRREAVVLFGTREAVIGGTVFVFTNNAPHGREAVDSLARSGRLTGVMTGWRTTR